MRRQASPASHECAAQSRPAAAHRRRAAAGRRRRYARCPAGVEEVAERAAGFSQNRDQPVHIEAATLEVRDKDKTATFSGNVRVTQGDTGLRCKLLPVFYGSCLICG